ncbi:Replication initiator protein A [Stieleria neptunia]|uniref:Replication initiator protein A n=1 Tax=Stieleria neptunia TaxID=2527979 RepID=A0A518HN83_9BACT|nr:replication initiator protein A [Stieleria neptunia]QDV42227.1 Replication initiator protein A [Stieleria neptunia]
MSTSFDQPLTQTSLIPERYDTNELFVCDIADAVLKDIMPQMEHPFYSLSKKPERNVREYRHGEQWIRIVPSALGQATIYDKDILIYAISQLMGKQARGEPIGRRIRLNSHDFLRFTNRGTGGKDYAALVDALSRLNGTMIQTNIVTGDDEQFDSFSLISSAATRRKRGLDGRLLWVELELSQWLFNAIRQQEVLTLHRDYFRLRKPLERRIYELARKHCGRQASWKCSVEVLQKKSGAKSDAKRFRQLVKAIVKTDHLPDYRLSYDSEFDSVTFCNRNTMPSENSVPLNHFAVKPLPEEAFQKARRAAPGWDVYYLERQWREWMTEPPRIPEAAFVGFCRKWYEKRGSP